MMKWIVVEVLFALFCWLAGWWVRGIAVHIEVRRAVHRAKIDAHRAGYETGHADGRVVGHADAVHGPARERARR